MLESAGLVESRRDGRYKFHHIRTDPLRLVVSRFELLLEPAAHPAVAPYRDALVADGIPLAQFGVDDVRGEHARLAGLGVRFTVEPTEMGSVTAAVFDDTCGNLIQIVGPVG